MVRLTLLPSIAFVALAAAPVTVIADSLIVDGLRQATASVDTPQSASMASIVLPAESGPSTPAIEAPAPRERIFQATLLAAQLVALDTIRRAPAGRVDDAVPGNVARAVVHRPADRPRRQWALAQLGDLAVVHYPAGRDQSHDLIHFVPGARFTHDSSD